MPAFDFATTTSLVTGASSGLGEQFARQVAARGSLVLAAARPTAGPAEQIAAAGLQAVLNRPTLDARLEGVIIGGVLGDTLLAALRRPAQENASAPLARAHARQPHPRPTTGPSPSRRRSHHQEVP
jgi:NAD(P)-dependent dehydrogenase (short-subunit alcohol dehydrogenase family)